MTLEKLIEKLIDHIFCLTELINNTDGGDKAKRIKHFEHIIQNMYEMRHVQSKILLKNKIANSNSFSEAILKFHVNNKFFPYPITVIGSYNYLISDFSDVFLYQTDIVTFKNQFDYKNVTLIELIELFAILNIIHDAIYFNWYDIINVYGN